ncbi:alpha/beta hydrolase [Streptomyces iconiensis]|uniref:Alpha/beta hydrolase n=1 Tax=Streptomyces iconiensis TaxID=1384038 RepID=A0ABT7A849_9ACTN|nr:alpha/beta hydrolase [Streptomyces iconiensis]MDJ1137512.1 alpha/beta hydrolase [Streptomyces iconiensis]
MVTYRDLHTLKRSEFTEAARGWREISNRGRIATEQVDNEMKAKVRQQRGETAGAAMRDLTTLSENFLYTQAECGVIAAHLEQLADDLAAPRGKLKRALDEASAHGLTVDDEGAVSYPSGKNESGQSYESGRFPAMPPTQLFDPQFLLGPALAKVPHVRKALEIAGDIGSAVSEADAIDQRCSRVLARLKTTAGLRVTAKMWHDTEKDIKAAGSTVDADDIPRDKSPAANAKWWKGLSAAEQDAYVSVHPAAVGALDGLPAAVRDDANRLVLNGQHADASLALQAHTAKEPVKYRMDMASQNGPSPAWTAWNKEREALKSKLGVLSQLKDPYAGKKDVPEHKQLYILGLDTQGDGKAAVAMGNPDTADHTAVHVPGTGTTLESTPGQLERIGKLQDSAMRNTSGGESVSTILWLGYDAPEIDGSVATPGRAHDAAADLRSFTEGTRTAHEDGRSHLTVLGHSYGSTAVGAAASGGPGLGADDLVFVGSPGTTVENAKDLQMDPTHVWAGATPQDPIPRAAADLTLGKNPAVEDFGAQPLEVNDGGHSSYWEEGQKSLINQGKVIAGAPATTGPYYTPKQVELGPDGHTPIIQD